MKYFTKQNSSLCSLHGKIGNQINNTVYISKVKNNNFLLKNLPPQIIVPHLMLIPSNFIAIFNGIYKFSLIGIVKPDLREEMKYDAEF